MNRQTKKNFRAVDFFCSAGGMTAGFRKAGIDVLGGIDIDPTCRETYTVNNPSSKFLLSDVRDLSFGTLETELGVKTNDDEMIFICCSPCQFWSKVNTDKTKSSKSKNLLLDFQRFVLHFMPAFIVVENVPGILRRPGNPLKDFLAFLTANRYHFKHDIMNASHFGVPQTRRRFLLIASRVTKHILFPVPDTKKSPPTVRQTIGDCRIFPPIEAGHRDGTDFLHTASGLSESNRKRLVLTKADGGTRETWSKTDLQIPAYVGKDGFFEDVYGRMYWDKPAPTLTTKFHSVTNGRFAHPEQHRAISLREGAVLQTFDPNYKFVSNSLGGIAKLIGNAVPPQLSFRIARAIMNSDD
ncbi:MAG: DNA cytosine methyltransferase [Pyrinomonadaceae bacterium]